MPWSLPVRTKPWIVDGFQSRLLNPKGPNSGVVIILGYQIIRGPALSHTDAVVVLTTIANEEEAVVLIRELLDRRLIACGTVQPGARSLYRWEGKVADEKEAMVLLKTRSGCIEGLRRAFGELHPYKVPELLAIPVTGGLERYLGWINSETSLTIA